MWSSPLQEHDRVDFGADTGNSFSVMENSLPVVFARSAPEPEVSALAKATDQQTT